MPSTTNIANHFADIYPDILTKHTENDLDLNGTAISTEQFLNGMKRCGFDTDFTRQCLHLLELNGTWFLDLNEKQKRSIFAVTPSRPSGHGFGAPSS
jgi:hypothetical protein